MPPLHELLALPTEVTIAGRAYRLSPLRLCDLAELERELLARRPHPLDAIQPRLAGLSDAQQRQLLALAYDDCRCAWQVSLADLQAWLQTPAGSALRFWLMLRQQHPELTRGDADRLWLLATQSPSQPMREQPAGN